MKKAGSSKSRFRTQPISTNTQSRPQSRLKKLRSKVRPKTRGDPRSRGSSSFEGGAEDEAKSGAKGGDEGAQAQKALSPQDEALFRGFQSNLLSLISHELRTPLTGILNALGVLEEGISLGGLSSQDLIQMARENALRLQEALTTLLDLGSLEGGSYHLRLRETDLCRVVRSRAEVYEARLRGRNLTPVWSGDSIPLGAVLLADPQKLGRAIDLCFQVLMSKAEPGTQVEFKLTPHRFEIGFDLARSMEKLWETSWSESGLSLVQGGQKKASPYVAFEGVLRSEKEFLSRVEDGFGSEFLLIHEIMNLHQGSFSARLYSPDAGRGGGEAADRGHGESGVGEVFQIHGQARRVRLIIELPELTTEEALKVALSSRAFQISTQLSSVCLILVDAVSTMPLDSLKDLIRGRLLRATDGVYLLPKSRRLALILDDCSPSDVSKLMGQLSRDVGSVLSYRSAQCPQDTLDPTLLVSLVEGRFLRVA